MGLRSALAALKGSSLNHHDRVSRAPRARPGASWRSGHGGQGAGGCVTAGAGTRPGARSRPREWGTAGVARQERRSPSQARGGRRSLALHPGTSSGDLPALCAGSQSSVRSSPRNPGLPLPRRYLRWLSNASRGHQAATPTAATVPDARRELEHRRPGSSARSATLRTEHAHTPNTECRAGP